MWLSPDEWMLYQINIIDQEIIIMKLKNYYLRKISKAKLGAVTDVSDQFVMINLKGRKSF